MLWDCFWGHFGQKHIRSSYIARRVLHPIFGCPANFEFSREKVLSLAEQQVHGVTSLEGQLSSAWSSDLFTHVFTHALSSQRHKQLAYARVPCLSSMNELAYCSWNQTRGQRWFSIAARLVDQFQTVGYLKEVYIKSFGSQEVGSSESPRTPLCLRACWGNPSCVKSGSSFFSSVESWCLSVFFWYGLGYKKNPN